MAWIFNKKIIITRHVFVKHRCPRRQQSQTMAKISKSSILTPPHPQGHVMSVKWEQPFDELTVQVWLLYDHPNFKYCTLFISGTELRTDGQMIQTLDAPGGPFRHKNTTSIHSTFIKHQSIWTKYANKSSISNERYHSILQIQPVFYWSYLLRTLHTYPDKFCKDIVHSLLAINSSSFNVNNLCTSPCYHSLVCTVRVLQKVTPAAVA